MLLNRIAVNIVFFLNGLVYANWVSRLPRIQEQFQADNGTIGLVLLAFSLGALGAMPLTGWVIIKNGSRVITLASLIIYCVLIPFIPFMVGISSLICLYIIMGISTGMLDVAMNAQAVMVERQYNRPIMTSFHAFFSIGMALGALCGALFANLDVGLSYNLIVVSALSLFFVVWIRRNLVEDKPDTAAVTDGPLFRMPNKALLSVGIIAFCCMLRAATLFSYMLQDIEPVPVSQCLGDLFNGFHILFFRCGGHRVNIQT